MDARELRIGNITDKGTVLVIGLSTGSTERIVCKYDSDITSPVNYDSSGVNPVPLTEEWLVKFGFSSKNVPGTNEKHFFLNLEDHELEICWQSGQSIDICYSGMNWANPLYHVTKVHQLQNLFFTLTGEELTIKEGTTNTI